MRENISAIYPDTPAFYKLTLKDGKYYVGSTKRLSKRLRDHRHYLETGTHHNTKFSESFTTWNEVQVDYVEYQYLELARLHEQGYLDEYYTAPELCNIATDVNSLWGGSHGMPQEIRDRIAAGHRGLKMTDAFKEQCRQRMLGTTMSEDQKRKISETLAGKTVTEVTRQRLSASLKGKGLGRKASPNALRNMSLAQQGRIQSVDAKRKIAEANFKRVSADGIEYDSLQACGEAYSITGSAVTYRINTHTKRYESWYFI